MSYETFETFCIAIFCPVFCIKPSSYLLRMQILTSQFATNNLQQQNIRCGNSPVKSKFASHSQYTDPVGSAHDARVSKNTWGSPMPFCTTLPRAPRYAHACRTLFVGPSLRCDWSIRNGAELSGSVYCRKYEPSFSRYPCLPGLAVVISAYPVVECRLSEQKAIFLNYL